MKLEPIAMQTPQKLPPLKNRKLELVECLTELTVDYLRSAYKSLFGKPAAAKNKSELVNETADALNFPGVAEFQNWFYTLPVLTQQLLYLTAFTDYVPIPPLEKKWKTPMLIQDNTFSWRIEQQFDPDLHLNFLPLYIHYDCPVTALPKFLGTLMSLWLLPPPLSQLSACRVPKPTDSETPWNNSLLISDVFPLLCDTVQNILGENEGDKILRGGFKKRDITELRSSTGFLPFDLGSDYAPDSVDLAARFILCMYNYKPLRPEDGQDGIRNLVKAFFSKESQYPKKWHSPDRNYLEYTIFLDHLSRTPGYYLDNVNTLPASRKVFQDILQYIAQDGGWFDADKLAEHIRITKTDFAFCDRHIEKSLRVKAETLQIDEGIYSDDANEAFHPDGIMRYYLLVRPLFKAYCYLFAILGLLEIIQIKALPSRVYRNKPCPLSPYDSLKTLRITEFGRWCLGLTARRPSRLPREYHAIADRELFLVTVQGNSLERQVYLDKIGQKLGENRWRISPASFIAGAVNRQQIAERIERFKALIDPKPEAHWEQLFKNVLDRAGLFDVNRSDMLVYDLPENPHIIDELLRDPELKHVARRAEGKMLLINAKDQRKFFALLNEHGIAHF